jgi:hypothetical protein
VDWNSKKAIVGPLDLRPTASSGPPIVFSGQTSLLLKQCCWIGRKNFVGNFFLDIFAIGILLLVLFI